MKTKTKPKYLFGEEEKKRLNKVKTFAIVFKPCIMESLLTYSASLLSSCFLHSSHAVSPCQFFDQMKHIFLPQGLCTCHSHHFKCLLSLHMTGPLSSFRSELTSHLLRKDFFINSIKEMIYYSSL